MMKKTALLLIAVAAFAGCQSDDPEPPAPVVVPVLIPAGTYPMQVHHQYFSPSYPDYNPDFDVDTVYMDSLIVSGNKDTIITSLKYGFDESKFTQVLGLTGFYNDTAVYRQPHPGFPTSWTLKYDTLNRKIEYTVITQTNHNGRWQTVARSF